MKRERIAAIYADAASFTGREITVCGWARTIRDMKNFGFVELNDGSVYETKGRVDVISGMIDKTTGTVSLRAVFDNKDKRLLSGGSANVIVPYDRKQCIVIPQGGTYEIQNRVFAYKVVDGKAVSTPIEVFEINDGTEYIVESGLQPGDVIVSEGAGLLKEGTVVDPTAAAQEVKEED